MKFLSSWDPASFLATAFTNICTEIFSKNYKRKLLNNKKINFDAYK